MYTHESLQRTLGPEGYALLMEQAKRDALRLRREAIAAFWAALWSRLTAPWFAVPRAPTVPSARPRARAPSSA